MAVDPNTFLPAYQAAEGGPGPALQSGLEGLITGRKLAIQQQQAQILAQLNAARANLANTHAERYQDLIDNPASNYKQVGQNADGTPRYVNTKTGEEISGAPGLTPSVGKGISGIADVRLASLLGRSTPEINRNTGIIELGQRIENLSSAPDIVKDPQALALAQDLITRQASGVGATVAGVKMIANETAPQFVSRVLAKITNQPQDAGTQSFMDQIKSESRADVNAAVRGLRGAINGPAAAEASLYDARGDATTANAIRDGSQKYLRTYLENSLGKKLSDDDFNDITGTAISNPRLKTLLSNPNQDQSPGALAAGQNQPPNYVASTPAPGAVPASPTASIPLPAAPGAAPAAPAGAKSPSGHVYQVIGG